MKKALSLIMAFTLCLSLCACGASSTDNAAAKPSTPETDTAVEKVIQLIDALADVTLSSGKTISAAEEAYAALSDAQKSAVTNFQKLTEARAFYDRIFNVYTLIEQIGTVSKDSETAIVAAEEAYQNLAMEERVAIINTATLTTARATLDAIPTVITLTTENFKDYFTLEHTYATEKKDFGGRYGRKIVGSVAVKQSATLDGLDGISVTVRVNCSVGRPKDGSLNAEMEYETKQLEVTVSVSATNGAGAASFASDYYVSKYWYPSAEVQSIEIIAVTGSITAK